MFHMPKKQFADADRSPQRNNRIYDFLLNIFQIAFYISGHSVNVTQVFTDNHTWSDFSDRPPRTRVLRQLVWLLYDI